MNAATRLLPQDSALPQLALALDAQAMLRTFESQLGGVQIDACQIERVKYRPQRNCSVAYRLWWRDALGRDVEQRVAARFCSQGDAARRYAKALQQLTQTRRTTPGPRLTHLPQLDMLAHWFPADAKLPMLALLTDEARLGTEVLPEVVAALTAGQGRLLAHRTTVVQHVPELRVCARIELSLQRLPGAPATTQTLYAKADSARSGARTQASLQQLRASEAQACGALRTPQPLLWQPATGLHWQWALPGVALGQWGAAAQARASNALGAQLAALHHSPVTGLPRLNAGDLHDRIVQSTALLGRVEPAWQPCLQTLQTRLLDGLWVIAQAPWVTLHGDLHPGNILMDGERPGFIDLDGLQQGPAVLDLGAWAAELLFRALLAGQALRQARAAWEDFAAAYARAAAPTLGAEIAPQAVSAEPAVNAQTLAWACAYQLLCRRACGAVANLKPGRFEAVPALLGRALALVHAQHIDAAWAATGDTP